MSFVGLKHNIFVKQKKKIVSQFNKIKYICFQTLCLVPYNHSSIHILVTHFTKAHNTPVENHQSMDKH